MKTREITVYAFDELSDAAKERARDWYRQSSIGDGFWSESVIDDASTIAGVLGIDLKTRAVPPLMGGSIKQEPVIYWSGFSSQGDGASYVGRYRYRPGSARDIKAYAPADKRLHRIATGLAAIQRRYFYKVAVDITQSGSHYVHEHTMRFDDVGERELSATDFDTATELLRDFARWIYTQLEQEYEYQNSDEQVDESIRANEYEFTETGEPA